MQQERLKYNADRYQSEKDPAVKQRANHQPLHSRSSALSLHQQSRQLLYLQAPLAIILATCAPPVSDQLLHATHCSGFFDDMSDFGHYGGSDEEYATVRKHNAEVVCLAALQRFLRPPLSTNHLFAIGNRP